MKEDGGKKMERRIGSLLLVSVLLVSVSFSTSTVENFFLKADGQEEVHVFWTHQENPEYRSYFDVNNNSFWHYAERPQLIITFANGTHISETNQKINCFDVIHFTLAIPMDLFYVEDSTLDHVSIDGSAEGLSSGHYADFSIEYSIEDEGSWKTRSTIVIGDDITTTGFFTLNKVSSFVSKDSKFWNATGVGYFNDLAIPTNYSVYGSFIDTKANRHISQLQQEFVLGSIPENPSMTIKKGHLPSSMILQNSNQIWNVSENNALDLDGNLSTTNDQYFIKNTFNRFEKSQGWVEQLYVAFTFLEHRAAYWINVKFTSIRNWENETYFWFHANDWSRVSSFELDGIRDIVWENLTEGICKPGYYDIKEMTLNKTFEDLWISRPDYNPNEWFNEKYSLEFEGYQEFLLAQNSTSSISATFNNGFSPSGFTLFLDNTSNGGNGVPDYFMGVSPSSDIYIDSSEITHIFILNEIGGFDFIYPFESSEPNGDLWIPLNQVIDFGVRIYNVNGTIYPSHVPGIWGIHSALDYWYYQNNIEVNTTDFEHSPEYVLIDQIAFDYHFIFHPPNSEFNQNIFNYMVEFKLDQYFGNWMLYHFNQSTLEEYAFAVMHWVYLVTETQTELTVNGTNIVNSGSESYVSDIFSIESENQIFADIHIGGTSYIWGKDGETYNCSASTFPYLAATSIHETPESDTIDVIEENIYFFSCGFKPWEGYSIDNDPSFNLYFSASDISPTLPFPFSPIVLGIIIVTIITIIVAIFFIKRKK